MTPLDRLLAKVDPLFRAPSFDEKALPAGFTLGKAHRQLLQRRNGGYFFGGALHIFGACTEPVTHSLSAWNSPDLWRSAFGELTGDLVFFAENAFGDQFGLAPDGKVFQFLAEATDFEEIADDFDTWLLIAVEAPDELLARPTVAGWVATHGHLPHGSQLQAYPPFMFTEDDAEVQLEAVDAVENMKFHAAIANQIASIPEGARVKVEFTEEGLQITPDDSAEAT
jgi:hypothetical protein